MWDPDTLARLFRLYEAEGTLTPVVQRLCPDDLDALQPDAEGGLWCEIWNHISTLTPVLK